MPINRTRDRLSGIYLYNGMPLSNELLIQVMTCGDLQNIVLIKETKLKTYMLHNSIFMMFNNM